MRREPVVRKADILSGLTRSGLERGDTVLVHSSLSRFGWIDGGADAVIDALLEIVGRNGTLMMSAITTKVEFVIRCIEAAQKGIPAEVEPFDPAVDPTWAGTIAETFRRRSTTLRSLHPTHSVSAFGARAAAMIDGHENAPGPCGAGTPYARLTETGRGFILLMGVNHYSNTTLHGIEELAGCAYVLYPGWCRIPVRTPEGLREARTRVHQPYMPRRLGVLETAYIDGRAQAVTRVGGVVFRLVRAKRMREITLTSLEAEPQLLLTENGREAYRRMKRSGDWTHNPMENTAHDPRGGTGVNR